MNNYINILYGIDLDTEMFKSAKEALMGSYDKQTMVDTLEYLQRKGCHDVVIRLCLSLFADKKIDGEYMNILSEQLLRHFPYEKWEEYADSLKSILRNSGVFFEREQLLKMADTLEMLYAKGIYNIRGLIVMCYDFLSAANTSFSMLNATNVRIRSARIAYSSSRYNVNDAVNELRAIKNLIKKAEIGGLKQIVDYYIGICIVALPPRYSEGVQRIIKSKHKGYPLAQLFIKYIDFHSETSKEPLELA